MICLSSNFLASVQISPILLHISFVCRYIHYCTVLMCVHMLCRYVYVQLSLGSFIWNLLERAFNIDIHCYDYVTTYDGQSHVVSLVTSSIRYNNFGH